MTKPDPMRTFAWCLTALGVLLAIVTGMWFYDQSYRLSTDPYGRTSSEVMAQLASQRDTLNPWPALYVAIGLLAFGVLVLAVRKPTKLLSIAVALLLTGVSAIPAVAGDQPGASVSVSESAPGQETERRGREALVVKDDAATRARIEAFQKNAPVNPFETAEGQEAERRARDAERLRELREESPL